MILFSGAVKGEGKWFFEVTSERGLKGIVAKRRERHPKGADGLSLFDLTEMLMDWKAANYRSPGGSFCYGREMARPILQLQATEEEAEVSKSTVQRVWNHNEKATSAGDF